MRTILLRRVLRDPLVKHRKQNELARLPLAARIPLIQNLRKQDGRLHAHNLLITGIRTAFGRRYHKIFAAAQRANGMDGAALIFEKWAGNAQRKIP